MVLIMSNTSIRSSSLALFLNFRDQMRSGVRKGGISLLKSTKRALRDFLLPCKIPVWMGGVEFHLVIL